MKKPAVMFQVIAFASIFLLACLIVSLPGISSPSPSPTLASIPAVPTLSITQASSTEPLNPSGSGLQNENLLVEVPEGFKIGYEAEQNNVIINEMVAENETVQDWTTLITVQIFLGQTNITPAEYQENMTHAWFNACTNSKSYSVANSIENGYDFVLWQLYCPINPSTQKVEYAYMKAIQGNDNFYLVQVAFRYTPTEADITYWMQYLKQAQVCDSRIAERSCP